MMVKMSDPQSMRRDYGPRRLDADDLDVTWHSQLLSWFEAAVAHREIPEPNAMQVATAGASGRPSVRTVLAKGISADGVVFYTNYDSAKGRDLSDNPYAEAVFAWLPMGRQVRVAGPVERVSREHTERYFASRPRGSQIAAWASAQSDVLSSRDELDRAVTDIEARFGNGVVPPPPNWGGYLIRPDAVEFWQGRSDRLHDRIRYRMTDQGWTTERLAP
jgi:pyridoxamine 5'-phosphate oxidase